MVSRFSRLNWTSGDDVLLNSRLATEVATQFSGLAGEARDYFGLQKVPSVFITTSGTLDLKLVVLTKEALLVSAKSVNRHLQVTEKDIWAQTLPLFHVGGLGIEARSFLNGNKIIDVTLPSHKFEVDHFINACQIHKVTLTSLVPTQVYDLVVANKTAPKSMRAVVVGGAALSQSLYEKARRLGWPLLPSFGMSEAGSQIATASIEDIQSNLKVLPRMQLLSHVKSKISNEGNLIIQSDSLLTGYAYFDSSHADSRSRFLDPKVDGWFLTEDKAISKSESNVIYLELLGRTSDFFKIGGEMTSLLRLQNILEAILVKIAPENLSNWLVFYGPDERKGHVVFLIVDQVASSSSNSLGTGTLERVMNLFNQTVLPFERAKRIKVIPKIPRSPLGKIKTAELREWLTKTP